MLILISNRILTALFMALDFVRNKIKEIMITVQNDSDNELIGPTKKIEFNAYYYLRAKFKQTLLLFIEITNINRTLVFKYLLQAIEDSINSSIAANSVWVLNLLQLYILEALMDNCFSNIDTKEEFIPDDKKMTLIELYIKLDNPIYGANVKLIKKAYRTMLISLSKRSPTFFDGLTKTLQQCLNAKQSNNEFLVNIQPWIDLTDDLPTLGSFLKVLTTSLTLLSPSFYTYICRTITEIVMNVIKLSSDEYRKFCDQNNTIMIAAQVFDMIDEWDMKQTHYKWSAQFCLMLVRPNILLNQVRDFTIPMFKSLSEIKELKSDNDYNLLSVVLKGFSTISYIGAQPTLVNFMMKFIDFPISALKQYFAKPKDIDPTIMQELNVNFPLALLYCSPEKFTQIYGDLLLASKSPLLDLKFCNIMQKICRFTSEKPYSFRNELNCMVPLTNKVISNAIKNFLSNKEAFNYIIPAFAENSFFTRLVFLNNPELYASIMRMMKEGTIKGVEKLNSSMFNLDYVDDTVSQNFWQMLAITLDTYVALSRTTKFINSPEFAKIPTLAYSASEYVKAALKDTSVVPPPESWDKLLRSLEEIILLSMTRAEIESKKTVIDIIKNYIDFSEMRPSNANTFIVEKFRLCLDVPIDKIHKIFAESLRNEKLPPVFESALPTLNALFLSTTAGLCADYPLPNIEPAAIPERLKAIYMGIWASTLNLVLCLSRYLTDDMKKLLRYFLENHCGLGIPTTKIISYSVPEILFPDYFAFFIDILKPVVDGKPITKITKDTQDLVVNIIKAIHLLLERPDIITTADMFKTDQISILYDLIAQFAHVSNSNDIRTTFVLASNSLMTLCEKNNLTLSPIVRFKVAKNILIWIPIERGNKYTNIYLLKILTCVTNILNGLSFLDTTIPANDPLLASTNFTLFFTYIKEGINARICDVNELLKLLTAIMKENFFIGMTCCIAMGYDDDPKIRTAFLEALTNYFSAEVYQKIVTASVKEGIIELLMSGNFELVKFLVSKIPHASADEFVKSLVNAAAYKGREFGFLKSMVELELTNSTLSVENEEGVTRTRLFRGTGIPSKVLIAYLNLVAQDWLVSLMSPLIREIEENAAKGVKYQIDQTKLESGQNIVENREAFTIIFNKFIDSFENSIKEMPSGVIKAAQILFNSVNNQSQKMAYQSIASFLFENFICPALPEPKRLGLSFRLNEETKTCLLHLSTLLVVASSRERVGSKRTHYAFFNNVISATFKRLKTCYDKIVQVRISEVPHVLSIDPVSVTISFQKLIKPLIPLFDKSSAEISDNEVLKEGIFKLINKLNETDVNLDTLNTKTSQGEGFEDILEKRFHKTEFISSKGEEIFYLDISGSLNIPINMIVQHILKTFKNYENSRYTIVADIGSVNVSQLPTTKEIKAAVQQIPDYILKNISHLYCLRISPEFAKYLGDRELLTNFPPIERVSTIEEFKREVTQHTTILSHAAYEGLLPVDAVYGATFNNEKILLCATQNALVIHGHSNEIKLPWKIVIPYRSIKVIKPHKGDPTKIKIVDTYETSYKVQLPTFSCAYTDILEYIKRNKLVTTTRNLIYIERPTLRMLLLNVALSNLVSDSSDFGVRKASLNLIKKTLESTEIKSTLDVEKMQKMNSVGSVYEIAEQISDDIAMNNPDDVHIFFTEFAKTMIYLNGSDFLVSATFLVPWMRRCGQAAIENKSTLESLAQITASIPSADTCQFTQLFWGPITQENLLKRLLQMTNEFGNSSFISLFITVANNSKQLTSAIVRILQEDNGMTIFYQATRTLIELIIAGTFDYSCLPFVLHIIHDSFYNRKNEMSVQIVDCLYKKFVGTPEYDFKIFIEEIPKKEYKQLALRANKLCNAIKTIVEAADVNKNELKESMMSDLQEDSLVSYSTLLLIGMLFPSNNDVKKRIFKLLLTNNPQAIAFGILGLSYMDSSDKESVACIIAGLLNIVATQSEISINMVYEIVKKFSEKYSSDNLSSSLIPQEIVSKISSEANISLNANLIQSIIAVEFAFSSEHKITDFFSEKGIKNDILTVLTTGDNKLVMESISRIPECAFVLLKRFVKNPDDQDTINDLRNVVEAYPDIFVNQNLQSVYEAAEKSKCQDVIKFLVALAKTQKGKKQGKKSVTLFTVFLEKTVPQLLTQENITNLISLLSSIF